MVIPGFNDKGPTSVLYVNYENSVNGVECVPPTYIFPTSVACSNKGNKYKLRLQIGEESLSLFSLQSKHYKNPDYITMFAAI